MNNPCKECIISMMCREECNKLYKFVRFFCPNTPGSDNYCKHVANRIRRDEIEIDEELIKNIEGITALSFITEKLCCRKELFND